MTEEEWQKFLKGPSEVERRLLRARSYLRTLREIVGRVQSSLPQSLRPCRSLDISSMTRGQKRQVANLLVKQCQKVFEKETPLMQITYIGMINEMWNDVVRDAEAPLIDTGRRTRVGMQKGRINNGLRRERTKAELQEIQDFVVDLRKRFPNWGMNDMIRETIRAKRVSKSFIDRHRRDGSLFIPAPTQ